MNDQPHRRLGNLDLAPDAALPDLQRAFDRLEAGRMQQIDILKELNDSFGAIDLPAVSMSAFNRWALRVRAGCVQRPGEPAPPAAAKLISVTLDTRVLLVAALRALANDLERRSQ